MRIASFLLRPTLGALIVGRPRFTKIACPGLHQPSWRPKRGQNRTRKSKPVKSNLYSVTHAASCPLFLGISIPAIVISDGKTSVLCTSLTDWGRFYGSANRRNNEMIRIVLLVLTALAISSSSLEAQGGSNLPTCVDLARKMGWAQNSDVGRRKFIRTEYRAGRCQTTDGRVYQGPRK